MWVRDGVVVGIGCGVKERGGGDAKTYFSAAQAVYVHCFKEIRQEALICICTL